METLKKLLEFLSPLPSWLRVVIAALVTVVISVCVLLTACSMASSCGITQSVVNNIESDGNTIEMGVTPSTTTSTTASPEIPINAPLKNSMWAVFLMLTFSKSMQQRRICVEADDVHEARAKVVQFLEAFCFASDNPLDDYDIHSIVALPPLFYWD